MPYAQMCSTVPRWQSDTDRSQSNSTLNQSGWVLLVLHFFLFHSMLLKIPPCGGPTSTCGIPLALTGLKQALGEVRRRLFSFVTELRLTLQLPSSSGYPHHQAQQYLGSIPFFSLFTLTDSQPYPIIFTAKIMTIFSYKDSKWRTETQHSLVHSLLLFHSLTMKTKTP